MKRNKYGEEVHRGVGPSIQLSNEEEGNDEGKSSDGNIKEDADGDIREEEGDGK